MSIFTEQQRQRDAELVAKSLERAGIKRDNISPPENTAITPDVAADSDFTYGKVDRRGKQAGEQVVKVPQGTGFVEIYYDPSTRDARPIPAN